MLCSSLLCQRGYIFSGSAKVPWVNDTVLRLLLQNLDKAGQFVFVLLHDADLPNQLLVVGIPSALCEFFPGNCIPEAMYSK